VNAGASAGPVLHVDAVTVRFGGLLALDKVGIEVPPASLIGLVGPNGAGKTTMFHVCSGLLKPNAGTVTLLGQDITGHTPQVRARIGLARTFQQPEVFHGLSVANHLRLAYRGRHQRSRLLMDMFTGAGFRSSGQDENKRVEFLLELLMLKDVADTPVDVLPLGTTRLVEVGRALASGPKLVLLDEPLSGLDTNESKQLAAALRRTVDVEEISLLLVEHDVAMVLSLCSNIYVLDFGRQIAVGTPDAIRNDPAVKAAYLGDAPLEGRMSHQQQEAAAENS
jgi:branched-chain amino acid transport system ATP-binding protein